MIPKPPEGIAKRLSRVLNGADTTPTDWATVLPQYYGPNAVDPDNGYGEGECDDFISKIIIKYTGLGGTFSSWSERHAFIVGAEIGYLYVNHTEFIPVPKFWLNESHYFFAGVIMGRATRKVEDAAGSIDWKKAGAAIAAAAGAGTVWGPEVLTFIKSLFGA